MRLRGVVVIDLTQLNLGYTDDVSTVRGVLWRALREAPAGASVRLIVPPWDWWSGLVIQELAEQSEHLDWLTIECADAATADKWVTGISQHQSVKA